MWFLPVDKIDKLSQSEAEKLVNLSLPERVYNKVKSKRVEKIKSHIEDSLIDVVIDCKHRINHISDVLTEQGITE